MELSNERRFERSGLLYPMMVIAAIAVIVFSILGIASIAGWLPSGLVGRASAAVIDVNHEVETARSDLFQCTECGVIESIREFERG
jgi:hypothetical protein